MIIHVEDQMNHTIRLDKPPKRIVSLVPSQTELLFDLGLEKEVVGITKFCIYPVHWFKNKTRVGGTKNVNFEVLDSLSPDLIIANKEENSKADILALQQKYPVYVSDITTVEQSCDMILAIGQLTQTLNRAKQIVNQIQQDFKCLPQINASILYFIWSDPYMVVGNNTFIGHLINQLGMKNKIDGEKMRYKEISQEEIQQLNPDCILLSSEPFPFREKHIQQIKQFYKGKILQVDGELFSWYGSRMLKMKAYFEQLAHSF